GRFLNVLVTGAVLSLRTMVNCWFGARFVSASTLSVVKPRVGALLQMMAVLVGPPPGRLGNRWICRMALEAVLSRRLPTRSGLKARLGSETDPGTMVPPLVETSVSIWPEPVRFPKE